MALGATAGSVMSGIIARTLRLTLAGIAAGTILSLALSRTMATLLFGTEPTDPVTFGAMILLLAGVALTAGYIPARRASRINPTIALRNS
jgi:ABC-type antimicrobial peptide transport system permease subunit